jgi:hypothetical protein
LSIAAVDDRLVGYRCPNPVALVPDLPEARARVVDPASLARSGRGLVAVLSASVCAVAAGARSRLSQVSTGPPTWNHAGGMDPDSRPHAG